MSKITRRRFIQIGGSLVAASAVPSIAKQAHASTGKMTPRKLTPRKLPVPIDNFGTYEPAVSPDGNTIYFARFSMNGDKRVTGASNIFAIHRIRQDKPWPGVAQDWSEPERMPDAINGDASVLGKDGFNLEPWITPDGNTLYFQSNRAGSLGIWESHRQPGGRWSQATLVAGGGINTDAHEHCFMPFNLPGHPKSMSFISNRQRENGEPGAWDIYTTRQVDGVWQKAKRYSDKLLDSLALKCRFNLVTQNGFTLGIATVHDFGKYHSMLFVHYDPATGEWKGPVVTPPFHNWNIDGACPNFLANDKVMIWSAGYDRGPDIISSTTTGGVYDLYWLPTHEVIAFYKAQAGLA